MLMMQLSFQDKRVKMPIPLNYSSKDGNPTMGYSKQKPSIRLMFWSGADFEEAGLNVVGKKFKEVLGPSSSNAPGSRRSPH